MTDEVEGDHILLLTEMNEKRVRDLEANTNGQVDLTNSFDALRILTFIEHITMSLGIQDEAELDFQGRRSDMLDKIEDSYQKMMAAKEAAERQARLAGGPVGMRDGRPMRPGPGGIVRP
jgi:hypothetical protein